MKRLGKALLGVACVVAAGFLIAWGGAALIAALGALP